MKIVSPHSRAFTLIEVLISLAILMVILTIVISAFSSFNKNASVNASVQIVLSTIEEARIKTLASQNESAYGVHFENVAVVLFKGDTYNALDPENETKALPNTVTVSNTALNGGGSDIIFERLSGVTNQYGTVTLSSSVANTTRTITIEQAGIAHE